MATILKGAPVVAAMNERSAALCEQLKAKGITPTLAVVRVGERGQVVIPKRAREVFDLVPGSELLVRQGGRRCQAVRAARRRHTGAAAPGAGRGEHR